MNVYDYIKKHSLTNNKFLVMTGVAPSAWNTFKKKGYFTVNMAKRIVNTCNGEILLSDIPMHAIVRKRGKKVYRKSTEVALIEDDLTSNLDSSKQEDSGTIEMMSCLLQGIQRVIDSDICGIKERLQSEMQNSIDEKMSVLDHKLRNMINFLGEKHGIAPINR